MSVQGVKRDEKGAVKIGKRSEYRKMEWSRVRENTVKCQSREVQQGEVALGKTSKKIC